MHANALKAHDVHSKRYYDISVATYDEYTLWESRHFRKLWQQGRVTALNIDASRGSTDVLKNLPLAYAHQLKFLSYAGKDCRTNDRVYELYRQAINLISFFGDVCANARFWAHTYFNDRPEKLEQLEVTQCGDDEHRFFPRPGMTEVIFSSNGNIIYSYDKDDEGDWSFVFDEHGPTYIPFKQAMSYMDDITYLMTTCKGLPSISVDYHLIHLLWFLPAIPMRRVQVDLNNIHVWCSVCDMLVERYHPEQLVIAALPYKLDDWLPKPYPELRRLSLNARYAPQPYKRMTHYTLDKFILACPKLVECKVWCTTNLMEWQAPYRGLRSISVESFWYKEWQTKSIKALVYLFFCYQKGYGLWSNLPLELLFLIRNTLQ